MIPECAQGSLCVWLHCSNRSITITVNAYLDMGTRPRLYACFTRENNGRETLKSVHRQDNGAPRWLMRGA
jgi:hypothetical protein